MAETEEENQPVLEVEEEEEPALNYKPPAEKSIDEILKTDQDDASLANYKKKLLGDAADATNVIVCKWKNLLDFDWVVSLLCQLKIYLNIQ